MSLRHEWKPPGPGVTASDVAQRTGSIVGKHSLTEQIGAGAGAGDRAPVQRHGAVGGLSDASVHEAAVAGLRGSSQPLPHGDRIQQLFGVHDVSRIEAHVGGAAAPAAARIGATAYATGNAVAFQTAPDLHTAAHEAAHVVQQRSGVALNGGVGRAGDCYEQHADAVADAVVAGQSAEPLLDRMATPAAQRRSAGTNVQRSLYYGNSAGKTDLNAIIPIANFIGYVENVEKAYPQDSLTDTVTRIRMLYYNGFAFEQAMIGARTQDPIDAPAGGGRRGGGTVPHTVDKGKVDDDTYNHLTAHADENAKGDNPSPYIQLVDGKMVDVGHMLLGLDSLAHPETGNPYSAAGVPGIDVASWVADLGIASVWMTEHERNSKPPNDAPPNRPARPDLKQYYKMSAPDSDLLGDVDSFGMDDAVKGQPTLSAAMRAYYLGQSGTPAGVKKRWQTFVRKNGLTYTRSGNTITWDSGLKATLTTRIDAFNDVFAARNSVWDQVKEFLGFAPAKQSWPHTPEVVDMFLAWVKPQLEAELASTR